MAFGLFRSLFDTRNELSLQTSFMPTMPAILARLDEALRAFCAGYFEFSRAPKVALYRKAREALSYLWMEIEFSKPNASGATTEKLSALSHKILHDWIPGLSGTLKKIEKRQQNDAEAAGS